MILKIITKILFRCKNVEPYFKHKQDTKKASKNRAKKYKISKKFTFAWWVGTITFSAAKVMFNLKPFKWRILSRTSTEQSGKNEKKKLPTGLQVHLEDMF